MSNLKAISRTCLFGSILVILLTASCRGTQATVNETWSLVELITKGEQTNRVTEIVEVRNCNAVEQKTVSCSAGTSNELSVGLGTSIGFDKVVQVSINPGVGADLGVGRESGESLDLEPPPEGFIYQYTVNKEFRVLRGEVLARSSAGSEQKASYAFQANCSLRIESVRLSACSRSGEVTPTGTDVAGNLTMPTPAPTSPPTPVPSLTPSRPSSSEEDVVDVVRRFNADQTTAVSDLHLDILRTTCTGRCLNWHKEYIEQLVQNNLYEVQEQLDFEVLSVLVSGNTAEVITRESWRTAKYDRSTHKCRFHQPTFSTQQTYSLVHEGEVWKISWDNFDTPAPADIPGC